MQRTSHTKPPVHSTPLQLSVMPNHLATLSLLWSFVLFLAPVPTLGNFDSGDCSVDDSPDGDLVTSVTPTCSNDSAAVEVVTRSYDDIRSEDRRHVSLLIRIDYICIGDDGEQIRGTPWTTDYRDRRINVTNLDTFFDVKDESNPKFTATVQKTLQSGTNCTFYVCYKQRRLYSDQLGKASPVSCVTDINECNIANGGCQHSCNNTIGSFICSCDTGYQLDGNGLNCSDINKCEVDDLNNCHENAQCTDTEGSYSCSCNPGYTGDGVSCRNIDECEVDDLNNCHENAQCTDTVGNYTCSCYLGYTGDGVACTNVDECESDDLNNCHENAQCTNTVGSYTCSCNPGYTGDGVSCTNFNECESKEDNNCHEYAQCIDTEGSFSCSCNPGYTGDGVTCRNINECELELHPCHCNANCTDSVGSFKCTCGKGFEGDGFTCTDIDECEDDFNNCDENAQCTNTEGSFTCSCYPGYAGDGRTECTGLILPATLVSTGVLIIIIVLLCVAICVMYKLRRTATPVSKFHELIGKDANSGNHLPVGEPDLLPKEEVKV